MCVMLWEDSGFMHIEDNKLVDWYLTQFLGLFSRRDSLWECGEFRYRLALIASTDMLLNRWL